MLGYPPLEAAMNRKRFGLLLFNDVEVLDFCVSFEVFSVARMEEAGHPCEPAAGAR